MIKTVQYCFEQYFNGKLNDLLKKRDRIKETETQKYKFKDKIDIIQQRPRNVSLKIKQILYNRDPEM